jgi:Zn-dependent protease/CBS domain-containing protein
MKWSWKLARVAGIDVSMHATFLLLIGWVAVRHYANEQSLSAVVSGVAFILALFLCVVLHEFGHALMARHFGIATRDITLLPIGGVARLERMPEKPIEELWVALAGPAVNVAIVALLYGWLSMTTEWQPLTVLTETDGPFLERLLLVNVFLAGFNLLPAFPMDGGRVLRALLATRMEYTRATQRAASIGQVMAFGFGFLGLMGNPFLIFIAFFVWIGAAQEASMVQISSALAGIPVRRAMVTDFRTLAPHDTVGRAVDWLLAGAQKDFPVVDGGRVVGLVLHGDLPGAIAQRGAHIPVAEIMHRDFQVVDSHEMLELAFKRLQTCDCHTMPVVHEDRLVGMMTMDNMGEFLAFQTSRGAGAGTGPGLRRIA